MCQTCKRFKKFVRTKLPIHAKNLSNFLLEKKSAAAFGGGAVMLIQFANAQDTLVAVLCGALVIIWWQWMGEGNFKIWKKWVGIILMIYIMMFEICPYIQNRVSSADLRIGTLAYRSDANDMLVDITNNGPGELGETRPRLEFVDLATKNTIWIESGKASFIRPGETVVFRFPKPDPIADYSIITIESIDLLSGYAVEPFYKYTDEKTGLNLWSSYYRNMGLVNDDQSEIFDGIIQAKRSYFYNKNWGKFKWIRDIFLT